MIGKLPDDVLKAIFETIPIEFSVLDKDDKVLAWNKHDTRIFKRPEGVVGRNDLVGTVESKLAVPARQFD